MTEEQGNTIIQLIRDYGDSACSILGMGVGALITLLTYVVCLLLALVVITVFKDV